MDVLPYAGSNNHLELLQCQVRWDHRHGMATVEIHLQSTSHRDQSLVNFGGLWIQHASCCNSTLLEVHLTKQHMARGPSTCCSSTAGLMHRHCAVTLVIADHPTAPVWCFQHEELMQTQKGCMQHKRGCWKTTHMYALIHTCIALIHAT